MIRSAVLDKNAAIAMLREFLYEAEVGSLSCIALRVFHPDGSWEDLVLGGTKEEQAKAQALSSGMPDLGFSLMRRTISAPGAAAAIATAGRPSCWQTPSAGPAARSRTSPFGSK